MEAEKAASPRGRNEIQAERRFQSRLCSLHCRRSLETEMRSDGSTSLFARSRQPNLVWSVGRCISADIIAISVCRPTDRPTECTLLDGASNCKCTNACIAQLAAYRSVIRYA